MFAARRPPKSSVSTMLRLRRRRLANLLISSLSILFVMLPLQFKIRRFGMLKEKLGDQGRSSNAALAFVYGSYWSACRSGRRCYFSAVYLHKRRFTFKKIGRAHV